jgi:hypothetical protein
MSGSLPITRGNPRWPVIGRPSWQEGADNPIDGGRTRARRHGQHRPSVVAKRGKIRIGHGHPPAPIDQHPSKRLNQTHTNVSKPPNKSEPGPTLVKLSENRLLVSVEVEDDISATPAPAKLPERMFPVLDITNHSDMQER